MQDGGSIVEFFYNIVPGSLFLLILTFFFDKHELIFSQKDLVIIILFIYLVLSLLLGFVFQGITIFFRQNRNFDWNNRAFKKVAKENPYIFQKTLNSFNKKLDLENNHKHFFYLMDSKLRADKRAFLPTHFSSLFAFWANIFFSTILILLIAGLFSKSSKLNEQQLMWFFFSLLITSFISSLLADKFLKSFYATIINCYYVKCIDKKASTSSRHN